MSLGDRDHLIAPGLPALGVARFLLGISTGLMSAVAPAYMQLLLVEEDKRVATNYVTASTALGFGLGAAVTSLFVFHTQTYRHPVCGFISLPLCWHWWWSPRLRIAHRALLKRLCCVFPAIQKELAYGLAILLAWATVGLVIAILPSTLSLHGLSAWSGFATFGICSCGVLFQPWAKAYAAQLPDWVW